MNDYKDRPSWQRQEEESGSVIAAMFLICMGITIGASLVYGGYKLATPSKPADLDCRQCHGRIQAYTEYFRKAGSKDPSGMARAVLSTRNPALMSAISKVETNGNNVRSTGYKKLHDGPWQVNRKVWGHVPHDVTEAALQAEFALESHLAEEKSLTRGLNAYGGESDKKHGKYARAILAELQGVPR